MRIPGHSGVLRARARVGFPPAALVLAALAVVACAPDSDGVRTRGSIVADASALHVFATTDSLATVRDLDVLDDGSVWVLNSVEPLLLGFGPRGDLTDAQGRRGGGPTEFGAPAGFVAGGLSGQAWVLDRRRHALIQVSSPVESREEIHLPRADLPPGSVVGGMGVLSSSVRTERLGESVILPRRIGSGELEATAYWTAMFDAELVALDPETGSVRTVVSVPDVLGDLRARFESVSGGFPPFPLWFRLWTVCHDDGVPGGHIRLYDFVRDELRGFDADGAELDPIAVPTPFTSVTSREFARVAFELAVAEAADAVSPGMTDMSAADSARILDALIPRIEGTPERLAAVLPKYVDLRCSEDGTMWLRPLDLERGGMDGGPVWLRIASDGEAHQVSFPERFDPFRFVSGRVWGVVRDEFDIPSLAWMDALPVR